ncbi:MAG: flavin reductase [Oscillospiraceae bacterium]
MDKSAIFKLSYGLFVLTARDAQRDNGCIINTVMQITDNPLRIVAGVNKQNFTHDMIVNSREFNISVLTVDAPFSVFEAFGMCSGRDVDKFAACENESRTGNGLRYIPKFTNAVISARVTDTADCGTHTLFTAEVTDAATLSDAQSLTYAYYHANIKPKPVSKKKGWVCKICGYVYEGEVLPVDFICPICKHGAVDFEPINLD